LRTTLCEKALSTFREWNEHSWVAVALLTYAGIRAGQGDFVAAIDASVESAALYIGRQAICGAKRRRSEIYAVIWSRNISGTMLPSMDGVRCVCFAKWGDRHGEATALVSLADMVLRCNAPGNQTEAREFLTAAQRLQAEHPMAVGGNPPRTNSRSGIERPIIGGNRTRTTRIISRRPIQ